jgi:hypothetical protein
MTHRLTFHEPIAKLSLFTERRAIRSNHPKNVVLQILIEICVISP